VVNQLSSVPTQIGQAIVRLRGLNVMLDSDLARLYGVDVRTLNQAVRRNSARFPADFVFRLTANEARTLRSQIVLSNLRARRRALRSQTVILDNGRGRHRKYTPYAFTEQGVAMLSSVLRSPRAIVVNVEIMRAFVQLRRLLDSNAELTRRLAELERKYDGQFKVVFDAIRQLMSPSPRSSRRIGFRDAS
jgi:hypothetical protein